MNLRTVSRLLGVLVACASATMLAPLLLALLREERDAATAFALSIGAGAIGGLGLVLLGGKRPALFFRREAIAVVGVAWFVVPAVGALPFVWTGATPSLLDAYFESVSGFTTTGASVIADVESLPRSVLLWRAVTHWLGGIGIVVAFLAFLPVFGAGGRSLVRLETAAIDRETARPRVRDAAVGLVRVYLLLTAAEFAALLLCGLSPFDAICHTFATVATGGFSTRNASIAAFDSIAVELVVLAFMVASATNFALYDIALRRRRGIVEVFRRDPEFRLFLGLLSGAVAVTAVSLWIATSVGPLEALRRAAFNIVSIGTTTGFASDDFDRWPEFARLVVLLVMFVGGCAGSTSGGLKVFRLGQLWKGMAAALGRFHRPRSVVRVRFGDEILDEETLHAAVMHTAIWAFVAILGTVSVCAFGLCIVDGLSAVLTTLDTTGPGLGVVGPMTNYAGLRMGAKAVLVVVMVLGRLEVYTVLALLRPSFWRD